MSKHMINIIKYPATSISSFIASIPLAQINEVLQTIALVVAIVSGLWGFVKSQKKK